MLVIIFIAVLYILHGLRDQMIVTVVIMFEVRPVNSDPWHPLHLLFLKMQEVLLREIVPNFCNFLLFPGIVFHDLLLWSDDLHRVIGEEGLELAVDVIAYDRVVLEGLVAVVGPLGGGEEFVHLAGGAAERVRVLFYCELAFDQILLLLL